MAPTNQFEVDEVEVKYLPANPEICFIKGIRGRLRSKTKLIQDEKWHFYEKLQSKAFHIEDTWKDEAYDG